MPQPDIGTRVAERLRYFRTRANLSQADLAERVGISPADVSRYETMARTPGLVMLERLADSLGVTTADLVARPAADLPSRRAELLDAAHQRLTACSEPTLERLVAVADALLAVDAREHTS